MPRSTEIVGEKTNSTGLIIHRIIAYVVLVLLVVVSLFPFYLLIINATRGRSQAGIRWYPDHFLATNFKNLFSGSTAVAYGSVWRSLANSLFISACASLLSVYFSALTAYATHVYQFKLRKFADMFILIVMMVPGFSYRFLPVHEQTRLDRYLYSADHSCCRSTSYILLHEAVYGVCTSA